MKQKLCCHEEGCTYMQESPKFKKNDVFPPLLAQIYK
jgi:hypothetical protein